MKKEPPKSLKNVFILLGIFFLFSITQVFVPPVNEIMSGSKLFLVPFIVFFFLGIALFCLAKRHMKENECQHFLYLTSFGAVGVFTGIFLHNAFYALMIISGSVMSLYYLFTALEIFFFFFALIVSPLIFIYGFVASAYLYFKKRDGKSKTIKKSKSQAKRKKADKKKK